MSSLLLQEEEMFSLPTTPNKATPSPPSSTPTTTTTTSVPAPVVSAEKTHGIAIDEPSASFLLYIFVYLFISI
jgi:hypothetical protein